MAIHLVQRSSALNACLSAAEVNDIIVLLGEGVTAMLSAPKNQFLHACTIDINERGLADRVSNQVTLVTDAEVVQLCADYKPCVSWTQP